MTETHTTNVYADEETKEIVIERDGEEMLRVEHGIARTIARHMQSQADEAEMMERVEKFGQPTWSDA